MKWVSILVNVKDNPFLPSKVVFLVQKVEFIVELYYPTIGGTGGQPASEGGHHFQTHQQAEPLNTTILQADGDFKIVL